jgi:hypothetical protein
MRASVPVGLDPPAARRGSDLASWAPRVHHPIMRFHEPSQTVLVEVVGRPAPDEPAPVVVADRETEPVAEGRGPEPEPAPRP